MLRPVEDVLEDLLRFLNYHEGAMAEHQVEIDSVSAEARMIISAGQRARRKSITTEESNA